jgi:hypothetical protein
MIEYSEIRKSLSKFSILFFLLSLIVTKNLRGQQSFECARKVAKIYKLPLSLAFDWQSDKNGCKKLRSKYIDTIGKNKNILIGINKNIFMMIFGRPDLEEKDGASVIIYYYNLPTECENHKPSKKSDNGKIFFSFKNEMLFDIGQQVE